MIYGTKLKKDVTENLEDLDLLLGIVRQRKSQLKFKEIFVWMT